MALFEIDRELMQQVSGGTKCQAEFAALVKARKEHLPALEAWAADPENKKLEGAEGAASATAGNAFRALNSCLHPKPQ